MPVFHGSQIGPWQSIVALDVVLCELLRQLLVVQHSLRDFQAIVIDAVVRILCDAHLFSKKFNTSRLLPPPFIATFRLSENRAKLVCAMLSVRKVG